MRLSKSVFLSMVASMAAVNALVIPQSVQDLPAKFALVPEKVQQAVKDTVAQVVDIADDVANDVTGAASGAAASVSSSSLGSVQLLAEEDQLPLTTREEPIAHGYIVLLKEGVSKEAFEFQRLWVNDIQTNSFSKLSPEAQSAFGETVSAEGAKDVDGGIKHVYETDHFKGYSGFFTDDVANTLRRHPDVAHVEVDSIVHALASSPERQIGAPWGLSRISHRESLGLGNFNQYIYDKSAGEGVTAYVVDTGVNVDHQEFDGRAVWGATIPEDDEDADGNGHGTHCAGTIGSKSYGVSKNAKIVAIKVLRSNGSGTMSDVIKGVEVAANMHAKEASEKKKGFKGSTANMSLGGGKSPALDQAVNAAVKAGIHFAVAAGNDNADACNSSPAAAESPVTVGASTLSDTRAYFSNFGKCVDIFAPGLNILSTYTGSDSATAVLSGTSMASPHVCGLLTYFLSLQPESSSMFNSASITPASLKEAMIKFGSKDRLGDIPADGTPNVLVFNGAGKDLKDFWNVVEEEAQKA